MSELSAFKKASIQKSADSEHLHKIGKAIHTYETKVTEMKTAQFINWQQAREQASQIKAYVLQNLPELLEKFEQNISAGGVKVLWAQTAADARKMVVQIAQEKKARKIVKAKSMTTEEIELNGALESAGIEVLESDLGELIVQLAGEKPYHIVTPAMHKSKQEISRLFHEKLGSPLSESAEELTMVARAHLRNAYITADIGITGANFLIADPGAISLTENEGNIRLSGACPPVHIAIAGIEKIIPHISHLPLFLPLLATSGTGQQLTGYNSIYRGPRLENESDGPREMYLVLLDNGRSGLYANPEMRESLKCIRCGACLNACPVYQTVGGHTYHTTYQGPIGSVITPRMRGFQHWHHLPSASSLCGACTYACPVKIPLHDLLLENRRHSADKGFESALLHSALKAWSYFMRKPNRVPDLPLIKNMFVKFAGIFLPGRLRKRIPGFSKQTFSAAWRNNEQPR